MQIFLGFVFALLGIMGIAVWVIAGAPVSGDERSAALLGAFLVLVGLIITLSSRKK